MSKPRLSIRELEEKDIKHISDYWTKSDPEYLMSLGVDLEKVPDPEEFRTMLLNQLASAYHEKQNYALIWCVNNEPIGHCNINQILFGNRANMHVHIWNDGNRKRGYGAMLIALSLPLFFKNFNLKNIYCEPFSANEGPNRILAKVGFRFIESYTTIPGSINLEQEVNKWIISE